MVQSPVELPGNHGREEPYKPTLQGRQEADVGSLVLCCLLVWMLGAMQPF